MQEAGNKFIDRSFDKSFLVLHMMNTMLYMKKGDSSLLQKAEGLPGTLRQGHVDQDEVEVVQSEEQA